MFKNILDLDFEWPMQELSDSFTKFLDTTAQTLDVEIANGENIGLTAVCVLVHPNGNVTMCSNAPPRVANSILSWHLIHAHQAVNVVDSPRKPN